MNFNIHKIIIISLLLGYLANAQSLNNYKKTKKVILISTGATYVATYTYLGITWYSNYKLTKFHFFNDWKEWKQMDKLGHIYGAFQESRTMYNIMKNLGDSSNIWFFSGFIAQFPIEILDGFSEKWGASVYDALANLTGSLLLLANYKIWNKEIFSIKFSFFPSPYSKQYPNLLGKNLLQQIIKDYNGQTYWLTFHNNSIFGIALGYSANNLIGQYNQIPYEIIKQREYRQWFLAPDIQFSNIKTNKKFLKTIFFILDGFKFPTPALEYNRKDKFKFHWIYF